MHILAVFSAVQTFYLKSHGIPVGDLQELSEDFLAGKGGVYTTGDADLLSSLMDRMQEGLKAFFGMWSICEAPVWAREPMRKLLERNFDAVMIGYREVREELRLDRSFSVVSGFLRKEFEYMSAAVHTRVHICTHRWFLDTMMHTYMHDAYFYA